MIQEQTQQMEELLCLLTVLWISGDFSNMFLFSAFFPKPNPMQFAPFIKFLYDEDYVFDETDDLELKANNE